MNIPDFLEKTPPPRIIQRLYHGLKIQVWEGVVKIGRIEGWVKNPRIEIAIKQYQSKVGDRDLTQDEVFDLMKQDVEFKLKELRDDILKNGLREPIVLTFKGKLLDGNRRFFALRYALDGLTKSDPNRSEFERIPAYVMIESASEEDERHVLVEENFAASLKHEWPDYVKARYVKIDAENGLKPEEIAAKYSWKTPKVKETIRILEVVDDFLAFATTDPNPDDEHGGGLGLAEHEAERIAAENYQFFNEAQKSFFNHLKTDFDFKTQFFKWINDGKFASFPEVRIAHKAWNHPEAKPIIMGSEPTAAKDAKAVLDYNARIVRSGEETGARIEFFVGFLKGLKVEQVASLPDKTIEHLREALILLEKMTAAATEVGKSSK